MKIISNSECYVQKQDIEFILDNNKDVPYEVVKELEHFNNDEYKKIENKVSLEYILNSQIPCFNDLECVKLSKLETVLLKIKIELLDSEELDSEKLKEIDEIIKERKNREYIIKQLKQIIDYKKHNNKIKYPSIPNPNKNNFVSNGLTNAYESLNPNEIVLYNIDGSEVDINKEREFINIAYKILMHDEIKDIDNINLYIQSNNNYLIAKMQQDKILKLRKKMK